jgi:hypothetical protein
MSWRTTALQAPLVGWPLASLLMLLQAFLPAFLLVFLLVFLCVFLRLIVAVVVLFLQGQGQLQLPTCYVLAKEVEAAVV